MNTQKENALTSLQDEALIALFKADREDAFSVLLVRYKPLICSQVFARHFYDQDAEDLTQEAWIAFLSAVRRFDPSRGVAFSAFLRTCVQNHLNSIVRSHANTQHLQVISLTEFDESTSDVLAFETPEPAQPLNELLPMIEKLLSEKEKQVLTLFLRGLSYQEMSDELHISAKSVDNALSRIRAKVRSSSFEDLLS